MSIPDSLGAALAAQGVAFGNGKRPTNATTRYIVAWFDGGTISDRSLRSRDGFSQVGTFHCYGQTVAAAQFAYDALTEAVLGLHRATVDGRVLLMPEQLTARPIDRDDKVTPPLFDAICEWRFRASPESPGYAPLYMFGYQPFGSSIFGGSEA